VVLELGLLRRADRAAIKCKVENAGYAAVFHFVDADVATRRERLLRRNTEKGATFSFEVTPVMFDTMESYFERPIEDELSSAGHIETRSSQIAAAEERLRRAMLASDVDALDALVSADLIFTSHTGAVVAKQDDLDMYRSGVLNFQAIDLSAQKILTIGHVAVVSVRARLSGLFGGVAFKEDVQFSRTWCRAQAGHWQIIAGHATRLNLESDHANI